MKSMLNTLIATALLTAAVPASASLVEQNSKVEVEVIDGAGGVYALVTVTSRYGFDVDGDLQLSANGQTRKVEPIHTNSQQVVAVLVGARGATVTACGDLDATVHIYGDNYTPVTAHACTYSSAETRTSQIADRPRLSGQLLSPAVPAAGPRPLRQISRR